MTERFVEESINLGKTYDKLIIFYLESLLNRPFPSILPVLTFTQNSSSLQDIELSLISHLRFFFTDIGGLQSIFIKLCIC